MKCNTHSSKHLHILAWTVEHRKRIYPIKLGIPTSFSASQVLAFHNVSKRWMQILSYFCNFTTQKIALESSNFASHAQSIFLHIFSSLCPFKLPSLCHCLSFSRARKKNRKLESNEKNAPFCFFCSQNHFNNNSKWNENTKLKYITKLAHRTKKIKRSFYCFPSLR